MSICSLLLYIRSLICSLTGVILLLTIAVMKETRSTIILMRVAKKLRKDTGNHRHRARAEDEIGSVWTLLYISCTRPLCKFHLSLIRNSGRSDLQIYCL